MPHGSGLGPGLGVQPTSLDQPEHDAFNDRFVILFLRDRGLALVVDESNYSRLSFTAFKQQYGVLGALWLQSREARYFVSPEAYEADRLKRGPRTVDTSRTPQPRTYNAENR